MRKRSLGYRLALITAILLSACGSKNPMAKIERVRDALATEDEGRIKDATGGLAACPEMPPVALAPGQPSPRDAGCLSAIANALGSKSGFHASPPDQVSDATVAAVIVRDGRGDFIAHADVWLGSMKAAKGAGADALRLAVAKKMAEAAPMVGRDIQTEADAVATLKAIAGAIPGACPTYWMIGKGDDPKSLAAEHSSEHSACVHKDLSRRDGVGGSYGEGIFRALEGSLALWREAERALRIGAKITSDGSRAVVEKKLAVIEAATQKNATKKIASATPAAVIGQIGALHADAGIVLWKDAGAGDGGAPEAGSPMLKRPLP